MTFWKSQHAKRNSVTIIVGICIVFCISLFAILVTNNQASAQASTKTITGSVEGGHSGVPVNGAHIAFENEDYTKTYAYAKSVEGGTFTIECPVGITGKLVCIAQNYDVTVIERFDSDYTLPQFILTRSDPFLGRVITGKITDSNGASVSDALVTYSFNEKDKTNPTPKFSGVDGTYFMVVWYRSRTIHDDGKLQVYKNGYYSSDPEDIVWWDIEKHEYIQNVQINECSGMSDSKFILEDAPASFDLSLERNVNGTWEHLSTVPFSDDISLKFLDFSYAEEDLNKETLHFQDTNAYFNDLRYSLSVVSIAQDYVFKKWEVINSVDNNGVSNGPSFKPVFEYNPYIPNPPSPDDPVTPSWDNSPQTGDNTINIIIGLIAVIVISAGVAWLTFMKKYYYKPKHI